MPVFWKIFNCQLSPLFMTKHLGFEENTSNNIRIPMDYIENKNFIVFRTCHGIGDWGLISAMPRLLKRKYPKCKIYLPTPKLLEMMFGKLSENWSSWNNPFKNVEYIFRNNPHIDGYKDYIKGIIYHDHYRIYNKNNLKIPLIEQMLKYWRLEADEYKDSQPELYFSKEEIKKGDKIINKYIDREYGCLLISDRYNYKDDSNQKIIKLLKSNPFKYFYWISKSLRKTSFNFIDGINFKDLDIDLRTQIYIKSKAKINIGNQCGMNDIVTRYSKVYTVSRNIHSNFIRGMIYL